MAIHIHYKGQNGIIKVDIYFTLEESNENNVLAVTSVKEPLEEVIILNKILDYSKVIDLDDLLIEPRIR